MRAQRGKLLKEKSIHQGRVAYEKNESEGRRWGAV